MTRIAIIRKAYRPDGGAERIVSRALQALSSQSDLQLTVITQKWTGDIPINVEVMNCRKRGLTRRGREAAFSTDVQSLLQQQSFDLVQSHERIPGCQIYRAGDGVHRQWLNLRAQNLNRWQRSWQERDPFHRFMLQQERSMFTDPRLRQVICNSRMVMNEISQHFEIAPEKLRLIYNGVDQRSFHPQLSSHRQAIRQQLGIPQDALTAISVGSGFSRKGVDVSLQALTRLTDMHLIIVGKDKEQPRYQRLAERLHISQRVHFCGVQQDVRPFYGAADLLWHPCRYDPFPNVTLEALACGLPVITTRFCGTAEIIQQGQSGAVLVQADAALLAEAMHQHFDNLHNLGNQRQAARQSVTPFTLERMSSELIALYQQLLQS